MPVAFSAEVRAILAERAGSPAPTGADPLLSREKHLLQQVTQYRKEHGRTPGTQGSQLERQVAELSERVAVLVSYSRHPSKILS